MSGAEFIAAAGVISSIIAIVDGIKQVVNAVSEADGLPREEVAARQRGSSRNPPATTADAPQQEILVPM